MDSNLADFKPQPRNRFSYFNQKDNRFYLLDQYFNIIDTIVAANGYLTDIHELLITDDNHFILMGDEIRTIDMSVIVPSGKVDANVMGTVIQEMDSTKNLIFEWKSLDHLPVIDCKGQDLTAQNIDYIHTNSLCIESDTTLIMSNRHLNELTKISRTTGNVIWRMGLNSENNQFTFPNDSMGFSYQHHARLLPNGNITLFDNGNFRKDGVKFSRACEYKIDELNKTATLVWQYRNTPDNISSAMGSVQRLDNGNTLIDWGASYPNVTEVDSVGNKVFEMSFPTTSNIYTYRALKYDIINPVLEGLTQSKLFVKNNVLIYPTRAMVNLLLI